MACGCRVVAWNTISLASLFGANSPLILSEYPTAESLIHVVTDLIDQANIYEAGSRETRNAVIPYSYSKFCVRWSKLLDILVD